MAICPKCNEQVSEAAVICPHCGCNINEYKDNIKAEKEKKAREEAERKRQEANERKKQAELADRLICPDCGRKVTLEDKICPKCGFPLDDKGERERMEIWHDRINELKPTFKNTWLVPIITGSILIFLLWDIGREDFLILHPVIIEREIFISPKFDILGLPFLIDLFAFIISIYSSIKRDIDYGIVQDNYETFMIKRRYITKNHFADNIKSGIAHCPFCKRKMTEKSLVLYNPSNPKSTVTCIRCEHCDKKLDFPGDRLLAYEKERQYKRNVRKNRWGF